MTNYAPMALGLDSSSSSNTSSYPEDVRRRILAAQLLQRTAADTSIPVYSKQHGIAKLLAGGMGGLMAGYEMGREKEENRKSAERIAALYAPQANAAPTIPTPAVPATPAIPAPAIAPAPNPAGVSDAGPSEPDIGTTPVAAALAAPAVAPDPAVAPAPVAPPPAIAGPSEPDPGASRSIAMALAGPPAGASAVPGLPPSPPPAPVQGAAPAPVAPAQPPAQSAPLPQYRNAISRVESGGRYDALGPVIQKGQYAGDRAYGKYQVMGGNIGPWSEAAIGRAVTPQEFVSNPQIQDAVFNHRFGQYAQKYGPEGASRAWFAGEGGMNDMGRRDQLGTSVADYGRKFMAGLPQQGRGVQVAALPGTQTDAMPQPVPMPTVPNAAPTVPMPTVPDAARTVPMPTMQGPQAAQPQLPVQMAQAQGGPQEVQRQVPPQVQQQLAGGIDRQKAMAVIADPRVSPQIKTYLLQQMQPSYEFTTTPNGDILRQDKRSGTVQQVYQTPLRPTYGVISKDQFGNEQYGWINPQNRTATPAGSPQPQGGAGASQSPNAPAADAMPPPPPGFDPKKWREEFSKRAAESKAGEMLPPKQEDIQSLRKEVQNLPSYKNHAQAFPTYRTMKESAGRNTRAADLNIVYGLGKIFDPGSVVREGEMIMVKNTASLPDWLMGTINSLNGGQALLPETRRAIMTEAHSRMKAYEDAYDYDIEHYRGIAQRGRMNVDDVVAPLRRAEPWEPEPKAPQAGTPNAPAPVGQGGGQPTGAAPVGPRPTLRLNPATGRMEPQ